MAILPDFLRKKMFGAKAAAKPGAKGGKGFPPAATDEEEESASDVDDDESSSESMSDAPQKVGGKVNPLKAWAAARAKG